MRYLHCKHPQHWTLFVQAVHLQRRHSSCFHADGDLLLQLSPTNHKLLRYISPEMYNDIETGCYHHAINDKRLRNWQCMDIMCGNKIL